MKWTCLGALLVASLSASRAGATEPAIWVYEPVQPILWESMQAHLKGQKFRDMLAYSLAAEGEPKRTLAERNEARLISAEAFQGLGFTYLAYRNWLRVARDLPSSNQANLALLRLSEFHSRVRFPDQEISDLINEGQQREAPMAANSMIAFYLALENMRKGYGDWAARDVARVDKSTYWGRRLGYYKALDLVRQNQIEPALSALKELLEISDLEPILKHEIEWQVARLEFETGNYDASEQIYAKMNTAGRDLGRVLLERAWIRYYKKDFSTALGMLHSLRAPYFDASRTSEPYLLSMLIYRELCHHEAVQMTADDFVKAFAPTFHDLKNKPLDKIPQLMSAVLVKANVLPTADLVYMVRREKELFERFLSRSNRKLASDYLALYARAEKEIRRRAEREFQTPLREIANDLLKTRDQVRLVKYVSGLEKYRADRVPASQRYEADRQDPLSFSQLYWPTKTEYWWDETTRLKVLVKDRCAEGRQ